MRLLIGTAATILAKAASPLLAAFILSGFRIDQISCVVVLLVFSGVMILTGPVMIRIAMTYLPQLRGATARPGWSSV